jgi:hypothetical protein
MVNINVLGRSTHSDRLERWCGPLQVQKISASMAGGTFGEHQLPKWYGPPIGVGNIPGNRIYATPDGDFVGRLDLGSEANLFEYQLKRTIKRRAHITKKRFKEFWPNESGAGFASLSDLISEATANAKVRMFPFQKTGPTDVVGSCSTLWRVGTWPPIGTVGTAAPGGVAETSATTGAFPFTNPTGGDTQHITTMWITSSLASCLLLYDRIFSVAKTINNTGTEAVSGVPTRYQATTSTTADYAGGNFLSLQVTGTALANTAHNWTVCQYTDQDGNTGNSLPSFAGNPGAVATITDRLDMPNGTWFAPLVSGDSGIQKLTQMQCSALVATGSLDFVLGHPLAWMPSPLVNTGVLIDGINSAFNLTRVFDSACLTFLEIQRAATTAVQYGGYIQTVAG